MINEEEKLDIFYEKLKDWIVKEYYNPGVRAEIILDMILSEYMGSILTGTIPELKGMDIKVLAREFPIDNAEGDFSRRNRKIDYLLAADKVKQLYIVELKTTDDSFERNQFINYLRFIGKKACENPVGKEKNFDMFHFYNTVCKNVEKQRERAKEQAYEIKSTNKYIFQLLDIMKEYGEENLDIRDYSEKVLYTRFQDYTLNLVYITLNPLDIHRKIEQFCDSKLYRDATEYPDSWRKYPSIASLKSHAYNIVLNTPKTESHELEDQENHIYYLFGKEDQQWRYIKEMLQALRTYKQ